MSDRYTKKDAIAAFNRLVAVIGGHVAKNSRDDGGYMLDHNGVYGGCKVEQVGCFPHRPNPDGSPACGVSDVFGAARKTAREFCDAVYFAEQVIRAMEGHERITAAVNALHREGKES